MFQNHPKKHNSSFRRSHGRILPAGRHWKRPGEIALIWLQTKTNNYIPQASQFEQQMYEQQQREAQIYEQQQQQQMQMQM